MKIDIDSYTRVKLEISHQLNDIIAGQLLSLSESMIRQQSHYFNGRYENLYLHQNSIPELNSIIKLIKYKTADFLCVSISKIKFGFWVNKMRTGEMTTRHKHDDDDELLSGVYYINAPANSGDLILHMKNKIINITPEAGSLVLFSPKLEHEVGQNKSIETRLSIGFNVGIEEHSS